MIAEIDPQMELAESGPNRGPVLVCDDQPEIRDFLSLCLRNRGYQPLLTGTGQECLRLAGTSDPLAILLDLSLPDACGLEVCAELSDSTRTRDIPVIVLSGLGEADTVRNVRRAGASFFLRKPCDPNTLLTILKQAIDQRDSW